MDRCRDIQAFTEAHIVKNTADAFGNDISRGERRFIEQIARCHAVTSIGIHILIFLEAGRDEREAHRVAQY